MAICALVVGGVVWLPQSSRSLLGHLPGGRTRNARAFRLQATATPVLMTMAVPSQAGGLALGESRPRSLSILTIVAAIDAGAVMIKAVMIKAVMIQSVGRARSGSPRSKPSG